MAEILGLIPARGASRGIPSKNIRPLAGRPLVQWTCEAAMASKCTRVIVSTACYEIGNAAMDCGCEWLLRPPELDELGVIYQTELHAFTTLAEQGYEPDIVVRLQPTSPLRTAADIDGCLWYIDMGDPACVSVHEATDHPWLVRALTTDGHIVPIDEPWIQNRQKYPPRYRINGAVYAARLDYWYSHRGYFGPKTQTYIMPRERGVIDIDDEFDWKLAEVLLGTV